MSCRKPLVLARSFWLFATLLVFTAVALRPPVASAGADEKEACRIAAPKNVAELQAIEEQVKKVVATVLPCTIGVQIGPARGSGVIVSEDGHVMTAGHVVGKPGQDVTFLLPGGKTAKGKTLGMYKTADAGLMKITDKGKWPFVEKGCSADLKPGAWCVAVGHPFGFQNERPPVIRVGRVLRARETVIQTDCPLVGGDSGGPLFDLQGRVIGINSRIGGAANMNYHVPVDVFHDNWDRLVKGDAWEIDLPGRDSGQVKAALREAVAEAGKCTVRVKCDGKDAALGTIVGPDGWILTKASQLKGKIVVQLRENSELQAQLIGVHQPFDLAMLKVDTFGLPAIQWSAEKPAVGQVVAAPGPADDPLAMGIVSVPPRKVPPMSGELGIAVEEGKGGARVERVFARSPAEKAGLKAKDVITHVDGKPTPNRKELIAAIKRHRPGEVIKLKVKRGDKELEISAKLVTSATPAGQKRRLQNAMGVGLSKRRDDFPLVLQHDRVVRPFDCGGPLVDLSGKVVGVNVARGGRTETYSVPADQLLPLMYDLMSGRLTPPDVIKEREKKAAEEKRAEEERMKAEEAKKAEEEKRKAEEAKKAEEEKRKAEEERKKAEAEKKADEERKKAEAEKKAEEERKKAEAEKKADEEKKKAEGGEENKADEKKPEPEKNPEEEQPEPENTP